MRPFRLFVVWSFVLFVVLVGPSLVAQAVSAVTDQPIPAASTADEWGNSIVWAIASSWFMRWLREHPSITGFAESTALKVQRLVSLGIGFANGLGISFVFDKHAGTLLISGLVWTAVTHGLRQFFFMEWVYQGGFKRATPATAGGQ